MPSSTERRPWEQLLDGNRRWVEECSTAGTGRGAARRSGTALTQHPLAAILGCSDSRVPAEILFDQGIGDLFVVRTAGHVIDTAVLGSIEYAVEVLGVQLVVVLGHDGCGAVAAATGVVDGGPLPPGHIRYVAERIAPHVRRARQAGAVTPSEVGGRHSVLTAELLRKRSVVVGDAVRRGTLSVLAAQYDLSAGTVSEVERVAA
ncbi:carbonic anhydrase [Actinoplanes sp. NPDC049265]|uniref:carbonic anhydrase n=1 Tax=Actinoplanes sp. NPDC049265 TaxID=3363902 RepID=UPI0037230C09